MSTSITISTCHRNTTSQIKCSDAMKHSTNLYSNWFMVRLLNHIRWRSCLDKRCHICIILIFYILVWRHKELLSISYSWQKWQQQQWNLPQHIWGSSQLWGEGLCSPDCQPSIPSVSLPISSTDSYTVKVGSITKGKG